MFKPNSIILYVSDCISQGPDNWIELWRHNDLGFYESECLALQCAGPEIQLYDIYAYKLFPLEFDEGEVTESQVPVQVQADLNTFRFLGFDVVSRSAGAHFECSALSCNHGAQDFTVNNYCLFSDSEAAYNGTLEISNGQYEPGPWCILEVYRKERANNGVETSSGVPGVVESGKVKE